VYSAEQMTNGLLFTRLLIYVPVLKVRECDQVFLLYFVKLINSVTLFFPLRHTCPHTDKNVQGKKIHSTCPAVLWKHCPTAGINLTPINLRTGKFRFPLHLTKVSTGSYKGHT